MMTDKPAKKKESPIFTEEPKVSLFTKKPENAQTTVIVEDKNVEFKNRQPKEKTNDRYKNEMASNVRIMADFHCMDWLAPPTLFMVCVASRQQAAASSSHRKVMS